MVNACPMYAVQLISSQSRFFSFPRNSIVSPFSTTTMTTTTSTTDTTAATTSITTTPTTNDCLGEVDEADGSNSGVCCVSHALCLYAMAFTNFSLLKRQTVRVTYEPTDKRCRANSKI